ncbi:MAG: isoprenylcysteine carboxylmethyltransferase family protein [Gallionella sp.]
MLLTASLMWLLNQTIPLHHWLERPGNTFGLILIGVAVLLDGWSLWLFFRAKTTFNPMNPNNTSHLVTTGLYRISRNPMYLGLLLMLIGWVMYLGSISPILLLPLFVWLLTKMQIEPEEKILIDKFGQEYQDYQQRVRRWI